MQNRSTKAHEAELVLFVRFRVISWIVLVVEGKQKNPKDTTDEHAFAIGSDL